MSEGHGAPPAEGDHHDESSTPFILWFAGGVAKGVGGALVGKSLELGEKHANDNHHVGGSGVEHVQHHDTEHHDTGTDHGDTSHGATGHGTPGHDTVDPHHKGGATPDPHHKEGADPHDAANDNEAPKDAHEEVAAHSDAA